MQFGFLSKHDLLAATAKWIGDRSRNFVDLLESEFGLIGHQRSVLEGLIREYQKVQPDRILADVWDTGGPTRNGRLTCWIFDHGAPQTPSPFGK